MPFNIIMCHILQVISKNKINDDKLCGVKNNNKKELYTRSKILATNPRLTSSFTSNATSQFKKLTR